MATPDSILQDTFGYESFRTGQRALIDAVLAGRDALGILPTGGGKSICYQVPALLLPGLTLVISPLISLMKDQVDGLLQMDIPARRIDGTLDGAAYREAMAEARSGRLKLLYVAPERLESPAFLDQLSLLDIALVAVDEAHCVSQWGHDFRPSYRAIAAAFKGLPQRPRFMALTATATKAVQEDIVRQLALEDPEIVVTGFDRPNLYFSVLRPANRRRELLRLLGDGNGGIVYCNSRKNVEALTEVLADHGIPATRYHAGLDPEERERNQEAFIYGEAPVIVATNAFGMGIDKPDVRRVIHYNMPKNIESYYQEAGRAGRDGAPAEAILFFNGQDILTALFFINQSQEPHAREKLNQMIGYVHTGHCLRHYLLRYFGESPEGEGCGHCALCNGEIHVEDVTVGAQMILSCIARSGQRFGAGMIVDILRGSKKERLLAYRLERLSTYGLLKDKGEAEVRDLITLLAGEDYIRVVGDDYPVLKLTQRAGALLRGEERLRMNRPQLKRRAPSLAGQAYDEALFAKLRTLRRTMAQNLALPPYLVFSDRTLMDLARRQPTDEEALLEVHGIGRVKASKYGPPFLSVIRGHLKDKNEA